MRTACLVALPAAVVVLVAAVMAGRAEDARLARIHQETFVSYRGISQ
ncbi:hypothetical protein [Jiella avicenniae]|uniref:Uncharacterized protein n=1 Tax=Jiella avicenniae TaxID=2907202 RepID=A0A9X1T3M2_9HYPH|nr:hypothetical protein [Jiella avicenniae]MCE7026395.1 hypothetical protein [Jiella avicenniae]